MQLMTAGTALLCKVLRSIPSARDQRFQARFCAARRGFHLTLATPISFSQFGGQSISSSVGAGLEAERLSAAQQAGSTVMGESAFQGKLWPCHRVVKVDGRSTEVFSMKSSAGDDARVTYLCVAQCSYTAWSQLELILCSTFAAQTALFNTCTCTDAGHSALQVLILPGNPGSAGYYEAYIAFLHAALQGRADIHAVSHLGHASNKQARQYRKQVPLSCYSRCRQLQQTHAAKSAV